MSNSLKLILIQSNNIKNIKNIKNNKNTIESNIHTSEYDIIKSNEVNKLKNPSKGQIYIHIDDDDEYLFYRFTGKNWIEIK